ncbi:MAG: hypothetical protein AAGI71_19145 [Bacteroidota bacterium]
MKTADLATRYKDDVLQRLESLIDQGRRARLVQVAQVVLAVSWLMVEVLVMATQERLGLGLLLIGVYAGVCTWRFVRSRTRHHTVQLEEGYVRRADPERLARQRQPAEGHLWSVSAIYQADYTAHEAARQGHDAEPLPRTDVARLYERSLSALLPTHRFLQGLLVAALFIGLLPDRAGASLDLWLVWFVVGGVALLVEGVLVGGEWRTQVLIRDLCATLADWTVARVSVAMSMQRMKQPFRHRILYRAQPWIEGTAWKPPPSPR